jgi:hypothetical protein
MSEGARYALVSILCECGVSYRSAREVEKHLDRTCIDGLTADRLADRLWLWMERHRDAAVCRSQWLRDHGQLLPSRTFLPAVHKPTLFG